MTSYVTSKLTEINSDAQKNLIVLSKKELDLDYNSFIFQTVDVN
jgi:hypothetical protein